MMRVASCSNCSQVGTDARSSGAEISIVHAAVAPSTIVHNAFTASRIPRMALPPSVDEVRISDVCRRRLQAMCPRQDQGEHWQVPADTDRDVDPCRHVSVTPGGATRTDRGCDYCGSTPQTRAPFT